MVKILHESNQKVMAVYHVALPDNSILFSTKPETQEQMLTEGERLVQAHGESIARMQPTTMPKADRPNRLISSLMKPFAVKYLGFNRIEIREDRCKQCGICAKVCSNCNIQQDEGYPLVGDHCEMCFACIHYCPEQAVRFKRMGEKADYQYHHPNVGVKEMIAVRQGIK